MSQIYDAAKIQTLLDNSLRYKDQLNLPLKWADNEKFRLGDQWAATSEKTKNMPRPVLNFIENIVTHKVASIQNENVKMVFNNEEEGIGTDFTRFSEKEWERLKFDDFNADLLDDCAVKGVAVNYFYIQPSSVGKVKLQNELIDISNFHVGNPKEVKIQKQPHVIVVQRLPIDDIQNLANANGKNLVISEDKEVLGQQYTNYQVDIDGIEKANLINFFYKSRQDGFIHLIRTCGNQVVEDDLNLNIRLYPFSVLQWAKVTNNFYSKSEVDFIKANQKQVNALMGIQEMNVEIAGFPKMWAKKDALKTKSVKNIPGEILIDHSPGQSLNFGWLNTAPLPQTAFSLTENLISLTRELAGASDVETGTSDVSNLAATSIMLLQKKQGISLDKLKRKFYQYIEDTGRIWIEFFCSYYVFDRDYTYKDINGNDVQAVFNAKEVNPDDLNIKIDVGVSSAFSEEFTMTALDKFYANHDITFEQYLKYASKNVVPFKDSLLQEINQQKQQQQQEALDYIMSTLSPTEKKLLATLSPEAQNKFLLQKANEEQQLGIQDQNNTSNLTGQTTAGKQ